MVTASVKQGVDPAKVEAAIDAELRPACRTARPAKSRPRPYQRARRLDPRVERIGGSGGKADALAECAVYLATRAASATA